MEFKRVLVTGGAGFIGSQLLKRLEPLSKEIMVLDNLATGHRESVLKSPKITFIHGSITNEKILTELLPGVDYIFHLACANLLQSVENIKGDFYTNLYGGFLLLALANRLSPGLKRFVYTSTASVYGEAKTLPTPEEWNQIRLPYAASKFAMEHYCQVYYHMYKLPMVILRLTNVFGPGQSPQNPYSGVVSKLFTALIQGNPLPIYGDGSQTRDFTYIEDTLDALLLAGRSNASVGQTYNVATGKETSILELAHAIMNVTGVQSPKEFMCKRTIDVVNRRCLDSSKLQRELGWRPRFSLEQGLTKTYQWLQGESQ